MKKILTLLYCFFVGFTLQAQTYSITSTLTPFGTAVEGNILTSGEPTSAQKRDEKEAMLNIYPNVEFLGDATSTYNCHSFAWNMSQGGATMWINKYDYDLNPNVSKYWGTNGGYIEVCNISEAAKIHYYSGDHSAIKSSVSGKYESKWGNSIRVRHDPTDVPGEYNGTFQKYFAPIVFSGPQTICGSTTYTVSSLPVGTTFNWSASGSVSISGSTSGSSVNLVPNGTGLGVGTLTGSITTGCGYAVISKNISVVTPDADFTSTVKNTPEGGKMLQSTVPYEVGSTYEWKLGGAFYSSGVTSFVYGPDCNNGPYQTIYDLELTVTNSCGQTSTICRKFEFVCSSNTFINRGPCGGLIESIVSGGDYQYQYYPNPAESELNIVKQKKNTSAANLKDEPVTVKLYNAKGEILRSGTINGAGNNLKWDTMNIPNGTYFLHIFEKPGTIKKQILIKH